MGEIGVSRGTLEGPNQKAECPTPSQVWQALLTLLSLRALVVLSLCCHFYLAVVGAKAPELVPLGTCDSHSTGSRLHGQYPQQRPLRGCG